LSKSLATGAGPGGQKGCWCSRLAARTRPPPAQGRWGHPQGPSAPERLPRDRRMGTGECRREYGFRSFLIDTPFHSNGIAPSPLPLIASARLSPPAFRDPGHAAFLVPEALPRPGRHLRANGGPTSFRRKPKARQSLDREKHQTRPATPPRRGGATLGRPDPFFIRACFQPAQPVGASLRDAHPPSV